MESHRRFPDRCPGYPLTTRDRSCNRLIKSTQTIRGEKVPNYWCAKCRKKRAAEIQNDQHPPGGIGPTVDNLVAFPRQPLSPDRWVPGPTEKIPAASKSLAEKVTA